MVQEEKKSPVLHHLSISAVVRILIKGARSRADLAVDTGLSKQTMSEAIRTLESAGWVHSVGVTSGRLGRSAILYEIDTRAGAVLGLDIGATRFKLLLSDVRGQPLAEREIPTSSLDPARLTQEIITQAKAFVGASAEGRPLRYVCLATPGVVTPQSGLLAMAPNLPALAGINLSHALREGLGCTVDIENDVNAAAVGERWQGEARSAHHAAYLALGTGIGVGLIADGRLLRGATGAAGEVSYLPIGTESLDKESISRGALERSLGVKAALADFASSRTAPQTVAAFLEALENDDQRAKQALKRIGELGALLVLSVQAMFDPQVIVLGGILGLAPPVLDALRHEISLRTARPVNLVRSALGLRAPVIGATQLALTGLFQEVFSPQADRQSLQLAWPIPEPTSAVS
ncbi:ROK family protein [Consotaella salsifontis]|uniref:Sugar kinase of the NBD/HSP70 family, may contain an N-terminal HTH domain n=1 Tax=Consotaella salsifontis TaxID=1365950 RepID=A0A1T4R9U5_9HYPH|nr:ROK family protein [Consotaella salsifontis]SKA12699.1 Sugar kinase of the NBD/HSP70 family, may contain an N-terminal HTH domain [Consotaella salsifontis]